MFRTFPLAATLFCAAVASVQAQAADEVIRHKIPGSDFPISLAVEIPASATVVNLSGAVPKIDEGDTEAQTVSVLQSIEGTLDRLGLGMKDVIKMQVFLVGGPANQGRMDFAGFMKGYTQFFGTEAQPNLPTRSVFQVAGLANPAWLVEIEVTAVRR